MERCLVFVCFMPNKLNWTEHRLLCCKMAFNTENILVFFPLGSNQSMWRLGYKWVPKKKRKSKFSKIRSLSSLTGLKKSLIIYLTYCIVSHQIHRRNHQTYHTLGQLEYTLDCYTRNCLHQCYMMVLDQGGHSWRTLCHPWQSFLGSQDYALCALSTVWIQRKQRSRSSYLVKSSS